MYADFECLLKGCDVGIDNDCFPYTKRYQDHIPCSFTYKVVYVLIINLVKMLYCLEEKM